MLHDDFCVPRQPGQPSRSSSQSRSRFVRSVPVYLSRLKCLENLSSKW